MNTIILKITDPQGWTYASNIMEHYSSFLGINYSDEVAVFHRSGTINVPKEYFSIEQLKEGIEYWFQQEKYLDKRNLLILTEDTEEQNKKLISMIKNISIKRDLGPSNNCIIICNNFNFNIKKEKNNERIF